MSVLAVAISAVGSIGFTVGGLSFGRLTVAGPETAGASAVAPRPRVASLAGQLLVAHGDNFDTGSMVMQTALRTASGSVPLHLNESEHENAVALAGRSVQVNGTRTAESFVASSIAAVPEARVAPVAPAKVSAATSAAAPRVMRVAVVLMRLPGSAVQPVTKAAVQATTFGATKSVAHWFSQMSGKQIAVTGTVYGYYPGVRSCDLSTQLNAAATAASKNGYIASNFDHVVVYTPTQGCAFAGIGWIGNGGVFLNGNASPGIMEHELGHNLGLWHAGSSTCGAAGLSQKCVTEYGDETDVMGYPYSNHGYSAEHKFRLGWIPASEVRTMTTGSKTFALTASENPLVAGSIELIHVRAPDGTLYAIDRRAPVGYDAGLSGVWIRRVASLGSVDTVLLRGSALAPGAVFLDSARKITIKTVTDNGPRATVRVCFGPCKLPAK